MIAPLVEPKVKPWSARAFARPAPARTLTGLPPKRPVTPVKPAPIAWPHRIAHPGYAEDDCSHWFQEERWADECVLADDAIVGVIGDTEWNAFNVMPGEHGEMPRHAWSSGGHIVYIPWEYVPPVVEPVRPVFDTSPLVKARERKEAEMLLKVPASADCLHTNPPPVVVADPASSPTPAKVASVATNGYKKGDVIDGVTVGCSSYGIIPIPVPHPDDLKVVLWREDGFGRGRLS